MNFNDRLKTTITFVDGVPQTNPAVIYNKYTVTEERATYTDVNGYFEFPNLDTSKYYSIEISNQEGTLLYTDTNNI